MIFKGKYKDILFIFLLLIALYFIIRIYQNYKFSEFLAQLPVEYQIGQRLMVVPEGYSLTEPFIDLINKYDVGNIKIYGINYRDKKQLYDLIIDCQNIVLTKKFQIPLFVATDQEGGWIAHLRKGFTIPPSSQAIGKMKNRHYAYLAGQLIASELKAVGINVNFAPVVDLSLNDENWVIGPRSYGSDPHQVVELASEFIKAHLRNSILPVIKHYPGLGRNQADPHVTRLTNRVDYTTLMQQDLYPFDELLKGNEIGLMAGNVAVPALVHFMEDADRNNYRMFYDRPAELSPIIIQQYLIKHKKYYGLIFSDELNIPPIKGVMPMEKAVFQALSSGVDIALVNEPPDRIIGILKYLKMKYLSDSKFRTQTIVSLKKILKYKLVLFERYNRVRYFSKKCFDMIPYKKDDKVLEQIDQPSFRELNRLLSLATTELYRDEGGRVPLTGHPELMKKNFILISSKESALAECRKHVKTKLSFIKMDPYFFDEISEAEINRVTDQVDSQSTVIMTILSRKYEKLVKAVLKKNAHLICINLLHEHNLSILKGVRTVLCTYSDNDAQVRAAFEYLFMKPRVSHHKILEEYKEF